MNQVTSQQGDQPGLAGPFTNTRAVTGGSEARIRKHTVAAPDPLPFGDAPIAKLVAMRGPSIKPRHSATSARADTAVPPIKSPTA